MEDATATLIDLNARETAILEMAQHWLLLGRFTTLLRRLIPATAAIALGILCFAWAANPPARGGGPDLRSANLTNASLRGVDLSDADLNGANLTGADLNGANLAGASITGVVWPGQSVPTKPSATTTATPARVICAGSNSAKRSPQTGCVITARSSDNTHPTLAITNGWPSRSRAKRTMVQCDV